MSVFSKNLDDSEFESNAHIMKQPLPMQYMGGKGRIVEGILDGLQLNFSEASKLVDLFAGSGVVSFQAMARGYQVYANDIQPYSSAILSSMLVHPIRDINNLIDILSNVTDDKFFKNDRSNYLADYFAEKSFITALNEDRLDWYKYQEFCESVKLCNGLKQDIDVLKKKENWSLFLAYYRNTYFGVRQCAEIDYLRELCEQLNDDLKAHLMACVVSSLTYCVSSTTHLAQFLKPSTEKNAKNILKRRNLRILDFVLTRLKLLAEMKRPLTGSVLNFDFKVALEKFELDSTCIVYADPPYFKEHYSRYYHVLDTFVLYDYPELTFNKRLGTTTIGRYRNDRLISDFGKKSQVRFAFNELCDSCKKYGNKLAISYACSSLVEKDFFYNLAAEKDLNLKVLEFNLVHTGQGQARHKQVTEFLFLLSNEKF
ncbi:MAG: DNA adenine methylase [Methanobacteriaceae archaeon]